MLGVSRALARVAPHARVGFAAFNEEEDGIVGSEDFAAWWTCGPRPPLVCAHILEIVGYASFEPGSQRFPLGPWRFLRPPHVRDFIGVLGNRGSKRTVERVVTAARESTSGKLLAARTLLGLERFLPDLDLSDPVRLWQAGIPAVLWTDTAFYRNPPYHLERDVPDTLSPSFMGGVAHLVCRVVLAEAGGSAAGANVS